MTPIVQLLMALSKDPGFATKGALADSVQVPFEQPAEQAGPPAPPPLQARQMEGRDETKPPGFMKDMGPMLLAQLADLATTEGVRMSGGHEDNPLVRKLQVGGSNAPAMAGSALIEALVLHALSKKHPQAGSILKTLNTAYRGTLAGQNAPQIAPRPNTDNRLNVWMGQ